MKITSVEPQKSSRGRSAFGRKNPNRFNIFLDGQFAFGADEDLVVDKRLITGKEITPDDLQILIEEAELGKLMERLYGLLGRRQRSEKEIRDYLKQLSFKRKVKEQSEISDLVADKLMEKLRRKGLVDDLEFARAWVESRSKKKGAIALKSELFRKGIAKEIVDEVLSISKLAKSYEYQVSSESQTARKLLEKRITRWKNLPKIEIKQKGLQFLMSRGFEYDIAKEVLENVLKEDYT